MLKVKPLALAPLYRYYTLTLENILAHFFIIFVVVIFISIFILLLKNVFFIIANSFVRNKIYLLTFTYRTQSAHGN